jgi:hypothetical protein
MLESGQPFSDRKIFLQRRYGAHNHCVIIRRCKKMLLKYVLHIAQPLKFSPEADIRADIKNLQRAERGDFVGAES